MKKLINYHQEIMWQFMQMFNLDVYQLAWITWIKGLIMGGLLVLLSSCGTQFQYSLLNTAGNIDAIYSTKTGESISVDTLNEFQFRNKLRTDFRFRYDFAQYALSQPRSFDWNNRILGNRYNFYNPYGFGYNYYWNRDQMWNDWVWGYPYSQPNIWSAWGYDRWGFNNYGWNNSWWNGYSNWYNGPWNNQGYNAIWNRGRSNNNVVYHTGRRGSTTTTSRMSIEDKIALGKLSKSRLVTSKPVIINKPVIVNEPLVINTKPRVNNSRPVFNNSKPIINNSRPSRIIRTTPSRPTRSSNNTSIRSNTRKNN